MPKGLSAQSKSWLSILLNSENRTAGSRSSHPATSFPAVTRAIRRFGLLASDVADVEEVPEGLRVTIRRGKTDQEGHGATIAIVRGDVACPVMAIRAWLSAAEIAEGPIFRPIRRGGHVQSARLTDRTVANIVKQNAERAGLDPALFSGHSLRAWFLTSAAKRGASLLK